MPQENHVRPGFEGGQMPLIRKLPRRGFNNKNFDKVYNVINVEDLNVFEENAVITVELLKEKNIIKIKWRGFIKR